MALNHCVSTRFHHLGDCFTRPPVRPPVRVLLKSKLTCSTQNFVFSDGHGADTGVGSGVAARRRRCISPARHEKTWSG